MPSAARVPKLHPRLRAGHVTDRRLRAVILTPRWPSAGDPVGASLPITGSVVSCSSGLIVEGICALPGRL